MTKIQSDLFMHLIHLYSGVKGSPHEQPALASKLKVLAAYAYALYTDLTIAGENIVFEERFAKLRDVPVDSVEFFNCIATIEKVMPHLSAIQRNSSAGD